MRPAQKAPENLLPVALILRYSTGFNEAGAKSAGKHLASRISRLGIDMLQ